MEGLRNNSDRAQGYLPFRQFPLGGMIFTVRTTLDPEQLVASARRRTQSVDPNQPLYDIRTLEQLREESIASERLNLTLLGVSPPSRWFWRLPGPGQARGQSGLDGRVEIRMMLKK